MVAGRVTEAVACLRDCLLGTRPDLDFRDRLEAEIGAVERTELDGEAVESALEAAIPGFGTAVRRLPLDGRYWAPARDQFEAILDADATNAIAYRREDYDCEDFAGTLMYGLRRDVGISTVGLVVDYASDWWGTPGRIDPHTYNVVVFDDETVAFFEPQTDAEVVLEDTGVYQLEFGRIVL